MAKILLYEQSQDTIFPDTFKRLTTNKALEKKDTLLAYSPFMNGNLIRVRGRLRHSPLPDAIKHYYSTCKGTFGSTYDQKGSSKMHAPLHRNCTTLPATKLHNFGSQKILETHLPPLFLVPPLSEVKFKPFHG